MVTAIVGTYAEVMRWTGACALKSAPDKILVATQFQFVVLAAIDLPQHCRRDTGLAVWFDMVRAEYSQV